MKRQAWIALISYMVFGICMYVYLFYLVDTSVPEHLRGSIVDPHTFLSTKELQLTEQYSTIRNLLFFLSTPYEWLLYYFLLIFGLSAMMERSSTSITRVYPLQIAIYLLLFSVVSFIAFFPFRYLSYKISSYYNLSTQYFSSWMKDRFIDFWVEYITMFIIVAVLYFLMKKFVKRWWLIAWLLFIPFTLFVMFIQPVVIDPLYNDFYPLKDKQLEAEILSLAEQSNIPADHVYEVNMSDKTNSINAYVTGIGKNSRIVLWDTMLERLSQREIVFIMGHEMGHYVEKHIYVGIVGYLITAFFGLWLASYLFTRWMKKRGQAFRIQSHLNISSLPALLLIASIGMFAISPISNAVSRYQEKRADQYAIQITEDIDAGISTFQELTKAGLSQVNPPTLVKVFRYGHPTLLERMLMLMEEDKQKENDSM